MEHCFSRFLGLRSKRLHPPPPPNGTQFPRQQVHHVQRAKGENCCSAQVHGQGLPGINEQCLSRCDCSHIPRGQLLPLSRVNGADASALNGFNAQAGGSASGIFSLGNKKSRLVSIHSESIGVTGVFEVRPVLEGSGRDADPSQRQLLGPSVITKMIGPQRTGGGAAPPARLLHRLPSLNGVVPTASDHMVDLI